MPNLVKVIIRYYELFNNYKYSKQMHNNMSTHYLKKIMLCNLRII